MIGTGTINIIMIHYKKDLHEQKFRLTRSQSEARHHASNANTQIITHSIPPFPQGKQASWTKQHYQ